MMRGTLAGRVLWLLMMALVMLAPAAQAEEGSEFYVGGPGEEDSDDEPGSLLEACKMGKLKGEVGINFRTEDVDTDSDPDEGDLGWSFIELDYCTAPYMGVTLGARFLGVQELWNSGMFEDEFSDDGHFYTKSRMKYLYLTYDIPDTDTQVLVGRKKFEKAPVMDGDVHEGVQLTTKAIPHTKLHVGVIRRWIDDVSESWDLDGIEDFTRDPDDSVDDSGSEGGDLVYTAIAEVKAIPDVVTLSPFLVHQDDVLSTYGLGWEIGRPVSEDLSLGLEGIYARYDEDTEYTLDEDATSYTLYGRADYKNVYFGLGYYRMSDDLGAHQGAAGPKAIGNYTFDPMEEGGYGGVPDDSTAFFDFGFSAGRFEVAMRYGRTSVDSDVTGLDDEVDELNVILSAEITEALSAEFVFADVDFDEDFEDDYQVYAGGLTYKF